MSELTEPGGKVRLYVEAALAKDARVTPDEGQAHYLLHVMRAKAGDRVSLFNGRDGEWLARIEDVTKRGCALVCEKQTETQSEVPDLWLVFAPIKKTPADYLTQKATELGVARVAAGVHAAHHCHPREHGSHARQCHRSRRAIRAAVRSRNPRAA